MNSPKDPLPEFIDLDEIQRNIRSEWLPIEELGVLYYRQWRQRDRLEVHNLILWLRTTEITETGYFKLLENFFPDGLGEEDHEEHARLFNTRYKGLTHYLCEVSRHQHEDDEAPSHWEVGQARRRVVFNKAYVNKPTNIEIAQFLKSHWNDFYRELRKRPQKYTMLCDGVNVKGWKAYNGEDPLTVEV